jgi:hypothetical protein
MTQLVNQHGHDVRLRQPTGPVVLQHPSVDGGTAPASGVGIQPPGRPGVQVDAAR